MLQLKDKTKLYALKTTGNNSLVIYSVYVRESPDNPYTVSGQFKLYETLEAHPYFGRKNSKWVVDEIEVSLDPRSLFASYRRQCTQDMNHYMGYMKQARTRQLKLEELAKEYVSL